MTLPTRRYFCLKLGARINLTFGKYKTFAEDQTKNTWKAISLCFPTEEDMCWRQKVKHSLARALAEPLAACSGDSSLGLGWILGNSACVDWDGGARRWWRRGRGRSGCSHRNTKQEGTSRVLESCPRSYVPPHPLNPVVNPASSASASATLA